MARSVSGKMCDAARDREQKICLRDSDGAQRDELEGDTTPGFISRTPSVPRTNRVAGPNTPAHVGVPVRRARPALVSKRGIAVSPLMALRLECLK